MADQNTTTATPPATPAATSPAPAAPAQPAAPTPTGDQAIAEAKGRPAGKPLSARDFSRAMGGGSEATEALITKAPAAAPQTPAPTQEPAAPATPPAEGASAATKPNRAGEPQPVNEKGQYQSPAEEKPAETGAADDGASPEPEATPEGSQTDAAETTAAADAVPEGYVRIEIPAELQRNFGTHRDVPKADEEFFRFNLNNRVRNAEIERLRKEAEEAAPLKKRLEELENKDLQHQVTTEAQQQFKETDQYKGFVKRYTDLKAAEADGSLAEGTASSYWQEAVTPAFKSFEASLLQSKNDERASTEAAQATERFYGEMWQRANTLPQAITQLPGFQTEFQRSTEAFEFEIEHGRFDNLAADPQRHEKLSQAFSKFFYARLVGLYPEAQQAIQRATQARMAAQKADGEAQQKAERERREREAAEATRREAEAAAARAATNPMGNVSSGQVYRHAEGATPNMNARQFDKVMSRRG